MTPFRRSSSADEDLNVKELNEVKSVTKYLASLKYPATDYNIGAVQPILAIASPQLSLLPRRVHGPRLKLLTEARFQVGKIGDTAYRSCCLRPQGQSASVTTVCRREPNINQDLEIAVRQGPSVSNKGMLSRM